MSGAVFSWINYVDTPGTVVSRSANDIDLTDPSCILDRRISKRYRIEEGVGGGSLLLQEANWGSAQSIQVLGAFGLNTSLGRSTDYLWNFEYLDDNDVWQNVPNATNTAQWAPAPGSQVPWNWIMVLPAPVLAKAVKIEWQLGTVGAWAETAYLWGGPGMVLPNGVEIGWGVTWRDHGRVNGPNPGGQKFPIRRQRYRELTVSIPADQKEILIGDETTLGFNDMFADVGRTGYALALPRSSDVHLMHAQGVLGLLSSDSGINHQNGQYFRSQLSIEEQV